EEGDWRQRKGRDRLHGVACKLRQSRLAAKEEPCADDVEREERERNRKAEPHDDDEAAEQDGACFDPAHEIEILSPRTWLRCGACAAHPSGAESGRRIRAPVAQSTP